MCALRGREIQLRGRSGIGERAALPALPSAIPVRETGRLPRLGRDSPRSRAPRTMWTSWVLLGLVLVLGVGAIGTFVWAVRSGVFSDIEDVKYRVLRAEEEDPAPVPSGGERPGAG